MGAKSAAFRVTRGRSFTAAMAAMRMSARARRTTEYRRDRRSFAAGAAVGGLVTAAAVVAAALALLYLPGHLPHGPTLVTPSHGRTHAPGQQKKTGSPSPTS